MKRRDFIRLTGGAMAAWPLAALAQRRPIEKSPPDREPTTDKEFLVKAIAANLAEAGNKFEYLFLLEASWRELPEEKRARFELFSVQDPRAPYWDIAVFAPRPKKPTAKAAIFESEGRAAVRLVP